VCVYLFYIWCGLQSRPITQSHYTRSNKSLMAQSGEKCPGNESGGRHFLPAAKVPDSVKRLRWRRRAGKNLLHPQPSFQRRKRTFVANKNIFRTKLVSRKLMRIHFFNQDANFTENKLKENIH